MHVWHSERFDLMDTELIRKYAQLMEETGLSALEIEEDDVSLRLERPVQAESGAGVAGQVPAQAAGEKTANAIMHAPETSLMESESSLDEGAAGDDFITSPMVGIFHAMSENGGEPFVKAGDTVKKGDTICIIEAMKLMNEIIAEEDVKIEKVLVRDGQLVEYGTRLFSTSR